MSSAPQSVVSGRSYAVVEVAGGPVGDSIADFLGRVEFVIAEPDGWRYVVSGIGAHCDTGVRFHEKDQDRHGHDVRIWQIQADPAGGFRACHDAAI